MARSANGVIGNRLTYPAAVLTAEPITMACWIRPTAVTSSKTYMSICRSDNNDDMLTLYLDNDIGAFRKGNSSGSGTANATGNFVVNTWQHLCGSSANAASRSCYRNGANKGTNAVSIAFGSTINRTGLLHASRMDQDQVPAGAMAEAGIWNVVLTDEEVLLLGKGFPPYLIRRNNLVAYWPLIGNESPEPDRWKNNYHMTVVGPSLLKADHRAMYY